MIILDQFAVWIRESGIHFGALTDLLLLKSGYTYTVLSSLSRVIEGSRMQYYYALGGDSADLDRPST